MPRLPRRGRPGRPLGIRISLALAVTLALLAGTLLLRDGPVLQSLEGQTLTWRFHLRGPLPPPDSVAIVALDDRTLAALGRWPLPRSVLAGILDRLREAGAAAVALDLLLLDPEPAEPGQLLSAGDEALQAAFSAAGGRVALGIPVTFDPQPDGAAERAADVLNLAALPYFEVAGPVDLHGLLRGSGILPPPPAFREGLRFGHVNVPIDADGTVRRLPLVATIGARIIPSLPLAAAALARGGADARAAVLLGRGIRLDGRLVPTDAAMRLPVNYYGGIGQIPTYSAIDLLAGRVAADAIAGRTVVVGATALGLGDSFVTPFASALPGAEVLATVAANILDGPVLHDEWALVLWDLLAIVLLAVLAFALAHLPSPALAIAASLLLLAGWVAVAVLLFVRAGLWLDMVMPSATVVLLSALVIIHRAMAERRGRQEAERQRANLARYQSPIIADLLADDPEAWAAGRAQDAAILFIDMAGFTTRSEKMSPADTARFLRAFHTRIERAALSCSGVLGSFAGDGAMMIFGVPRPGPADAAGALRCALMLARDVAAWSAELARSGGLPLRIGIGIHYGPVVLTQLGGERQVQLTVAGDTVNVASRLQSLTRSHDAVIAISATLAEAVRAAGEAELLDGFEALPAQRIRGREGSVGVWIAGERTPALAPDG